MPGGAPSPLGTARADVNASALGPPRRTPHHRFRAGPRNGRRASGNARLDRFCLLLRSVTLSQRKKKKKGYSKPGPRGEGRCSGHREPGTQRAEQ